MDAGTSLFGRRLVLLLLPLLLAVVATGALLVIPALREERVSSNPSGGTIRSTQSTTLVQSQGRRMLVPLAIPVALAGVPLAFGRTRWRREALIAAGALLVIFVVLSLPSIGLFYLPAMVAMIAAATVSGRPAGVSSGPVEE
jgi:hypothetical protein